MSPKKVKVLAVIRGLKEKKNVCMFSDKNFNLKQFESNFNASLRWRERKVHGTLIRA